MTEINFSDVFTIEILDIEDLTGLGSRNFNVYSAHGDVWQFHEPVFSEWMQADAGTFQSMVDYLWNNHQISAHSSQINAFLVSEMALTPK